MRSEEFERALAPIRALAALNEARRHTPGHPDYLPRRVGESREAYAQRVTTAVDTQVEAEMAAVAPVKPGWRKVALLWAADKGVPLFVSLNSAAAFACGAPEWGYGLLIGWAIGTVLS